MNIRSREVAVGLAMVALLSATACTAEKPEMKNAVVSSLSEKTQPEMDAKVEKSTPRVVDGVFASHEQLKAVYFELNQSKLTEKEMNVVKENADWLKSQPPFLIKVVGFTDSRGSTKKNARLGMLRAKTVRDSYIALGIPKERIMIGSRIDEEPSSCQTLTEDCLSTIRRSETLIEEKSLAKK